MVATYSIQVYRTRYFTLVGRVVNTFVVRAGFEPVFTNASYKRRATIQLTWPNKINKNSEGYLLYYHNFCTTLWLITPSVPNSFMLAYSWLF
jgi:hypothetical protein